MMSGVTSQFNKYYDFIIDLDVVKLYRRPSSLNAPSTALSGSSSPSGASNWSSLTPRDPILSSYWSVVGSRQSSFWFSDYKRTLMGWDGFKYF